MEINSYEVHAKWDAVLRNGILQLQEMYCVQRIGIS
jgi:hypothetical protein